MTKDQGGFLFNYNGGQMPAKLGGYKMRKLVLICEDSDCEYVVKFTDKEMNCECPICGCGLDVMDSEQYQDMITGGLDSDC